MIGTFVTQFLGEIAADAVVIWLLYALGYRLPRQGEVEKLQRQVAELESNKYNDAQTETDQDNPVD